MSLTIAYVLITALVVLLVLLLINLSKSRQDQKTLNKLKHEDADVKSKLDLLLAHTSDFVYRYNAEGQLFYTSSNLKRVLGYDMSEGPISFYDLRTDNEINEKSKELVEKSIKEKKLVIPTHLVEIKDINGDAHLFEAFEKAEYDENGKLLTVTGIAKNMTGQFQAEMELKESERKQNLILQAIPDFMVTFDKTGKFLDYQASNEEELFIKPEDFLNNHITDIFPEPLDQILSDSLSKAYASEDLQTVEYRLDISKKTRFYEARFIRLADDRVLMMARDITAQKQLEDGLREAKNAAEAATRAKSNFLATMSHEIRTPMNGVIGMTALLEETHLSEEQQDYLETIKVSGETLLRVINDILDFSKIESGKMPLEEQVFALKKVVEETMSLVAYEAEKKSVALNLIFKEDVPEIVLADRTRLRQILLNLLSNAVKFTERGFVTIRVELQGIRGKVANLKFSIKDTGIGIPQQKLNGLFSEFTQVDSSHSRMFGGTGLGLAIAKNLVKLFKGKITVESEEGKGSTFSFNIKVQLASGKKVVELEKDGLKPVDNRPDPLDLVLSNDYPLKILLAEDNSINRKLTSLVLERMGYIPDIAKTGREVMYLLKKTAYDVILMDVQMPVMDGIEATMQIKELNLSRPPFIIGISANAFEEDVLKAKQIGMDDYLVKPMKFDELRRKLIEVGQRKFPFVT